MSVEDTFNLLADAAGVRNPYPERENRGLCPAHGDHNNPALVFRIADSGKLVAHCFAQGCTLADIAESIGVHESAFFPGGGSRFAKPVPREFNEPSLLELLKLLPLGMSHEEREEAVFRCLDDAYATGVIDDNTIDLEQPMRELPTSTVLSYAYLFTQDALADERWGDVEDAIIQNLRQLNRIHRTNKLSSGSAAPRR